MMGDRPAVLAREMTKLYEEYIRGTLSEIGTMLANRAGVKGECTLLVAGAGGSDSISDGDLVKLLREALVQPGARVSDLSKVLAQQYNLPRKRVYEMALNVQKALDYKT